MISDCLHLRWAKQSFWQFKRCIIPSENPEFWAENMHLTHTCTEKNMNNYWKKNNFSTKKRPEETPKKFLNHPEKTNISQFSGIFFCWNYVAAIIYPREQIINMRKSVLTRGCRAGSSFVPQNRYSLFSFPFRVNNNDISTRRQSLPKILNAQLGSLYFLVYISP